MLRSSGQHGVLDQPSDGGGKRVAAFGEHGARLMSVPGGHCMTTDIGLRAWHYLSRRREY